MQEQQHDDCHQHDRVPKCFYHFIDRFAGVGSRVEANVICDAVGKCRLQVLHLVHNPLAKIEGVCIGGLKDRQKHRVTAVEANTDIVTFGAQLDPTNVLQANEPALLTGLDDDVFELLDVGQAAQRAQRNLGRLLIMNRLLADRPRGNLCILFSDRLDDISGRQSAASQFCRIDPDAHAVVALPEQKYISHTRQSSQFVFDLHQREIAQKKLIVTAVGRADGEAHQNVGRALERGHPGGSNHFRQQGHRQVDAVLHQHLRHVEVDPRLERHRQAVTAVVRALRRHVHDPFDAVDLLLDGRGDRIRHFFRARAGIIAGHLHGRRRDRGKLSQRQRKDRHRPCQRDHDGAHRSENRSIDEKP